MANLTLPQQPTRRQIRKLFKQTQHFGVMRQITRETGISESRISRWLQGERVNTPDVEAACLKKYAELLGTNDSLTESGQETKGRFTPTGVVNPEL